MADVFPFTRQSTPAERDAIAAVQRVAAEVRFSPGGGRQSWAESCPPGWLRLADMTRGVQLETLEGNVDWPGFAERGLSPRMASTIMMNAVDGKPPELWLTETAQERELRAVEVAGIEAMGGREILGGPERGGQRFDEMLAEMARRAPQTQRDRGPEMGMD